MTGVLLGRKAFLPGECWVKQGIKSLSWVEKQALPTSECWAELGNPVVLGLKTSFSLISVYIMELFQL